MCFMHPKILKSDNKYIIFVINYFKKCKPIEN